jgi:plasmid stabilization system protein ParE
VRVVWTELAVERAYEAAAYIAKDKSGAALRWLEGLFELIDRLETFPLSGRVVPEIGRTDFRELVYRQAYRIVYRIEKSRVLILTVHNFAQRFDITELVDADE